MFDPETVVKILVVLWLVYVAGAIVVKLYVSWIFWVCEKTAREGKLKVTYVEKRDE